MSSYEGLKSFEKEITSSICKGKNPTKLLREFASKLYQEGFKDGILESNQSWWSQMDQDEAYIDSIAERDAADNAKEWDAI